MTYDPEASKKQVARRLLELRMIRGLTQEQAAQLTGIHPTTYSRYERGQRVPNAALFLHHWETLGGTLIPPDTGGLERPPIVHDTGDEPSPEESDEDYESDHLFERPGGGKTTRCADTAKEWKDRDGLTPKEWSYFSFMKRNINDILKRLPTGDYPNVRTYHSAAMELAGVQPEQIADEEWVNRHYSQDTRHLLQHYHAGRSRCGYLRERRRPTLRETFDALLDHEREEIGFEEFRDCIEGDYLPRMATAGKMDFTDVLFAAMESRGEFPLRRVMADEAQDNTRLQNEFLDLKLAARAELLILSGDLNQSIFSFQGAEYLVNKARFEEGKVVAHDISYRCPWPVLEAAEAFCDQEHISGSRVRGEFLRIKAPLPPLREGENLVLCRDHSTLEKVGNRLAAAGVLFHGGISPLTPNLCGAMDALLRGLDGQPITKKELLGIHTILKRTHPKQQVRKIKGYLSHLRATPDEVTPLAGILPDFVRSLKSDPLQALKSATTRNLFLEEDQLAYVQEMFERYGDGVFRTVPGTELNTIHGAKGDGRRHVYLCCKTIPAFADGRAVDPEEERRVKYVGLTRSMETCTPFDTFRSTYIL